MKEEFPDPSFWGPIETLRIKLKRGEVYCPRCGFKTCFEIPEGIQPNGAIIKCYKCGKTLPWKWEW